MKHAAVSLDHLNAANPLRHFPFEFKSQHILIFVLIVHTILWTIGPYWLRPSLPHDTLEGITWGLQWQWGYSKHPFLTAWLCAVFFKIIPNDWSVYLLAQLAVVTTFLAVWQLAKQFLPIKQALVATLVLEGVLFYTINSFNLTPDTLQSPLWALLTLFFYQALTKENRYYWLLTGFFAALCVCTKYQVIVLLLPMLFFCCFNSKARAQFKKPGIYWALGCFLLVLSPHLIWLYQHDFMTLVYAQQISAEYTSDKTFFNHFLHPMMLLANGLFQVLGAFILLWPFYSKKITSINLASFQWQFLLIIGLGPLVLSLFLCAISGDYFPPRWLTPYFSLIGIIAVSLLQPELTQRNLKKFTKSFILFFLVLFTARMISLVPQVKPENDAFLPNQTMASALSKVWHYYYHDSLPYIAGSNYLVSMVAPYLEDKPVPYLSWQKDKNTWIKEADLRKKGALFIWDEGGNYGWDNDSLIYAPLREIIQGRFPELIILPQFTFYRLSNKRPIIIGAAILPPQRELLKPPM